MANIDLIEAQLSACYKKLLDKKILNKDMVELMDAYGFL